MKLLYISSTHPILEAETCLTWEKMGIDWFSTGHYSRSEKPGDLPYINSFRNKEILNMFNVQKKAVCQWDNAETLNGKKNVKWADNVSPNLFLFTYDFLNKFDVIIADHFIENINNNIEVLKKFAKSGRPFFLRTYSMHHKRFEFEIDRLRTDGLKVIRVSPEELKRGSINGINDHIIRQSVFMDEEEMSGWNGKDESIVTLSSYMNIQEPNCATRKRFYDYIVKETGLKHELYGFGPGQDFISHSVKVDILKKSRLSLIVGSPDSNVNYSFIESWVMGQPIVVFGPKMWLSDYYEVDKLVSHGVDGFIGIHPADCVEYCKILMKDMDLARKIGAAGREKALTYYSKKVICEKWKDLFKSYGVWDEA